MIVLYNPPSSAGRKPVLPMSLLALGAVLEPAHDYRIIDGNLEPGPVAAIEREMQGPGPHILGVTVMPGLQLVHALHASRCLRSAHPDLTIVWGGYWPTQHWETCLRSDSVDYVVRGHGEIAFARLAEAVQNHGSAAHIPGVCHIRSDDGQPSAAPSTELPHPDLLPPYPYHRLDVARYVRRTFMGKRTLPHHSGYGCPFHCGFCAVHAMTGGEWLCQSPERVAEAARTLVEDWAVDAVEFYDNNFFGGEARTRDLLARITPLGIAWWAEGRIDTLLSYEDGTWDLLRRSGLKMVFMGAESGSDATLQRMNKGGAATRDKTLAIAAQCRAYDIVPEFSFVLGSPPDPEADTRETIEFIRKVKQVNPNAEIILYPYTPVPTDGELYEQAQASGFRFPRTLDEWASPEWIEFAQRRRRMPWLDESGWREVHDFYQVLNAYYPTATDPRLGTFRRAVLRAFSAWRYHTRWYRHPVELRLLQRLLPYQRPETSGF